MAYASINDIRLRNETTIDDEKLKAMLDDAALIIDAYKLDAPHEAKRLVSCRMVARALADAETSVVPLGSSQGSMSAMGYSQSWTYGSGGSSGELYISKTEKKLLGCGSLIGSYSPVEELVE